jgi:hypothetical protein
VLEELVISHTFRGKGLTQVLDEFVIVHTQKLSHGRCRKNVFVCANAEKGLTQVLDEFVIAHIWKRNI